MVTLNNALVGTSAEIPSCESWSGVVFWLNNKAQSAKIYYLENWCIEISNSNFIVARTTEKLSNEQMRKLGYNACEKALDIFSADGLGNLFIVSPFEKNILLSNNGKNTSLWIYCVESFTLTIRATMSVMLEDGTIVRDSPSPQTGWENVFSYYRYSKLSNNIYDEYRWMYLVFESIMQKIAPVGFDVIKNKPTEIESKWILRALREAETRYGWVKAMNWPVSDAIEYFYREQYNGVRCNLFHSKGGHLQPNEHISLDTVFGHLRELERLCVHLLNNVYGINTHRSVVTHEGFESIMNNMFYDSSAFLSEDDISALGDEVSNEDICSFLRLAEISEQAVRDKEVVIHVYHAPFPKGEVRKIKSYGVSHGNEVAIYDYPREHTLYVEGIDDVYLIQMVKLVNEGDKKQHKHCGVVSSRQLLI